MRSAQRARYEYALGRTVRDFRTIETILRVGEHQAAADQYALLRGVLEEELRRSVASKSPLSAKTGWSVAFSSSRTE